MKENKENIFVAQPYGHVSPNDQNIPTTNNSNELRRTLSGLQITSDKCNNAADKKVCFNDKTTNYYDDLKLGRNGTAPGESTNSLVRSSSCHELYNRNNKKGNNNYTQVPQQQMYFTPAPCTCIGCIPSQMSGQMQGQMP